MGQYYARLTRNVKRQVKHKRVRGGWFDTGVCGRTLVRTRASWTAVTCKNCLKKKHTNNWDNK